MIGFDPIKTTARCTPCSAICRRNLVCMKIDGDGEPQSCTRICAASPARHVKQTFARLLEFTSLGPFTGRAAGKALRWDGNKNSARPVPRCGRTRKCLLLDEPSVGVDPISRRELWQMVHELAGEGILILWSTSYLDEAEQCRDVLLMNEGELLYQGRTKSP